ncbi:hypothetical protein Vadar_011896 [Vaccinium darrowii]|uniref:Uncharacterized protein n=1 Tax=Vaccinium darrowii TaxID=229202 RepID=A0ACB7XQ55_9ERIC|nr:hypothetical protein Vadar_011896 [Vaccinium darrowii]
MEIVDPRLLTEETYGSKMVECRIAIVKIGLACSTESPKDRMSINTVLQELHLVKNNILKGDKDSQTTLKASQNSITFAMPTMPLQESV